jgi:hypothetical protein
MTDIRDLANLVDLDDPLLAKQHATLERQRDGTWLLTANRSRNGVWVSAPAVNLNANCYFRCGEQRFRFTVP